MGLEKGHFKAWSLGVRRAATGPPWNWGLGHPEVAGVLRVTTTVF